jgi:thiol-disulfide isomerase/thioredoxin
MAHAPIKRRLRTMVVMVMSCAVSLMAVRLQAAAPPEQELAKSQAGEISKLHWQKSGMGDTFGGLVSLPLDINETVPNGLKSRPKGLVTPRYGTFELGPVGKTVSVFVILDSTKGQPGTLYVNRKADGEMLTELGHPMTLKTGTYLDGPEWTRYATEVSVELPFAEGKREVNLKFLRLDPKRFPDKYESYLVLAADCGYAGTTSINGKPVPTMVFDTGCIGEISLTDGRRHRPRFWFDLNRDGKRDPGEVVPGEGEESESFLFDGQWWAVASMGNEGTIRIVSPEIPVKSDEKKSFTTEQARALEDYLAAHPNARHFRVGLEQLFMHYRDEVKDKKKALAILEREYAYLVAKANPKELKEGLRFQFLACVGIEAEDRALVALEREHAFLVKETPRDFGALGTNLNDWVYRLTKSNKPAGVAKARELLARAKKEFAANTDKEGTTRLFAQCEGMCGRPVVGGTLKIAFTALDGTKVDLAAMKGKVVLVDYWATWCVPCVASLPGIKSAYDKYHAKGFEVIGISLDDAGRKDKVVHFLKDNKLPWHQSFDGKGWSTPAAVRYGVTAIPATILVGKDGRIAAVDIHGEELVNLLAKLLK